MQTECPFPSSQDCRTCRYIYNLPPHAKFHILFIGLYFSNLLLLLLYSPLLGLGRFFSFSVLYTVGRTTWTGDQPVTRSLPTHRTTHNKHTQTSMLRVGFEPTTSVLERTKTVHVLDGAATVISICRDGLTTRRAERE
jgi:hypothetical protein